MKRNLPAHSRLLRDARNDLAMSGAQAAQALGVAVSTYTNAENGRYGRVVFENLHKLLDTDTASQILAAYNDFEQANTSAHATVVAGEAKLLVPIELVKGLAEANITRFHPSRKYYRVLREGRASISEYVGQAQATLELVSITLATGIELERVIDTFEDLIVRRNPVNVVVSLLDPKREYLMKAIAGVVGSSPTSLAMRITDSISNLTDFRSSRLRRGYREHFQVHAHATLPNASAIIIDGDLPGGLVQLETKGYKMGMDNSFGFEVAYGSDFFANLRDSYRHLVRDGRRIF